MSAKLQDRLVEVQRSVRTRPLFTLRLEAKMLAVGATPTTMRRIGIVPGGAFEGERLSGRVLDGGSDWQSIRLDGSTLLDVRLNLETQDGAVICMTYAGIRHGPREVIQRLEAGEVVDPASYYFRIIPMFETASESYGWLNGIVAVGIGHRFADGPIYNLFEVL
ncbi:MAG: DUF3237 domain-containing protein [Alphaproteobacteria bacterium]|nr:DUF3237 domain-containing protein [Alphaproteobacteria bacterium]